MGLKQKNVGGPDRLFRFAVGFLSLGLVFMVTEPVVKIILGVVAVAGVLTAVTGYCPINGALKIDTTKK